LERGVINMADKSQGQKDFENAGGKNLFPENNNNEPDPFWRIIILVIVLVIIFGFLFYIAFPWIFSLFGG
jgi:hypothetical protein